MRNVSIFEDLRISLFYCDHTITNETCSRECLVLVFRIYGEVCICSHTHAHAHVCTQTHTDAISICKNFLPKKLFKPGVHGPVVRTRLVS